MHLPMTSIQDAWGVRTLDDRSDTTIPSRCNALQKPLPPSRSIVHRTPSPVVPQTIAYPTTPYPTTPYPTTPYPTTPYQMTAHPTPVSDDSELVGLLTMLLIFILIDKLFTIWNKS